MGARAERITHTVVAPGVIGFSWTADGDRGDGLLVDADVAAPRWCAVADVLIGSSVDGNAGTAPTCALRVRCARRRADQDWPSMLAVIVERYRAVLSDRDGNRVCELMCPPEPPPAST